MAARQAQGARPAPLYRVEAELFKTLGHPARLQLLELLASGPRSVGELQPEVGLESSHLSQQLGVLRRAGLVVTRKQGNSVIYSLASPHIGKLLGTARQLLTGLLDDQIGLLQDLKAGARNPARRAAG